MPREEVVSTQRVRILVGMVEAMHEKGFVGTPVAEVIKRAGVSRETFYQLFSSKLDCFLAAFELVSEVLLAQMTTALDTPGNAMERFECALASYLDALAAHPAYARLFLVEVYAAGPEAMQRRTAFQLRIVDALWHLFGAESEDDHFACHMIVAAVSAMVTGPLVDHDAEALRHLGQPLVDHVRRLNLGSLPPSQ
jgi:AcrR family transcriptional regulator